MPQTWGRVLSPPLSRATGRDHSFRPIAGVCWPTLTGGAPAPGRTHLEQAASLADRLLLADLFGVADDQRVILAERFGVGGKMRHEWRSVLRIAPLLRREP